MAGHQVASEAEDGVTGCWGHKQTLGSMTQGLQTPPAHQGEAARPPPHPHGRPGGGGSPTAPAHSPEQRGQGSPKWKQTSVLKKGISFADEPTDNHAGTRAKARS